MTVVAVGMVKDEADVVEGWIRHLASEVDWLLIADNASTDGTREILMRLADELPLTVIDDLDPGYRQSAKMTALAEGAAQIAFDPLWIVPVDADEIWYADGAPIRDALADCPAQVVVADITNHLRTDRDVLHPQPFQSMVWRQPEPQAMPKVAFLWAPGAVIHQGNHAVTLPAADLPQPSTSVRLHIRHFPVRSPEQYVRKARNGANAYAAAPELREDYGAHWRAWGAMSNAELRDAYWGAWCYDDPEKAGLVRDPAPFRRWS